MFTGWDARIEWEELKKVMEEQKDPDYWRKKYEQECQAHKNTKQSFIEAVERVRPLQEQIERLESALAKMWLEFKESEQQWEVDWYNAGDLGLIKSLLRGEDVVVPSTGIVRQVYKLMQRLTELEDGKQ